ncbi:nuclear transport factor 2 family protein [Psychroserpens sp. SPM9]|uniref:YybH family protein n=1 Tax=Psychroserpens sp. SPM9 TaxID=2975598 RepID=UPI0021A57CFE|nr:nuclear transport factor 2 family protein [Psychroserpens sp. SPM9]MDG5490317.1 nuclear transport factor 2 family protein [Psychroserpens sp. SPM9]
MKFVYYILVLTLLVSCQTESKRSDNDTISEVVSEDLNQDAVTAIKEVMSAQEVAWNNHDLEGFMKGYWTNENLKFYGSNGLTKGWNNTLANYKKGYPTKAESGTLRFVINDISKIENDNYWVMGEYHLTRDIGNANGVFMIIFKKINGHWKIVADMSC